MHQVVVNGAEGEQRLSVAHVIPRRQHALLRGVEVDAQIGGSTEAPATQSPKPAAGAGVVGLELAGLAQAQR